MWIRWLAGFLLLLSPIALAGNETPLDPDATAGNYFYRHGDFPQSLTYWSRYFSTHPGSVVGLSRVVDLQLLVHGRDAARAILEGAYAKARHREEKRTIQQKWVWLQGLFLSDEAQALYRQGIQKIATRQIDAAETFLQQAAALERGNSSLTLVQADLALEKKQYGAADTLVQAGLSLDPFHPRLLDRGVALALYLDRPSRVLDLAKNEEESEVPSIRRVWVALALVSLNLPEEAVQRLRGFQNSKVSVPTLAWYALGRAFEKRAASVEARRYHSRFLSLVDSDLSLANGKQEFPVQIPLAIQHAREFLQKKDPPDRARR